MCKPKEERKFWTLTEVSRMFSEPQHRLIYLCEEGIVEPASQSGTGRGSSRKFSSQNLLEFAIVLRLRDLHLPSPVTVYVLRVLKQFSADIVAVLPDFRLPESLWEKDGPDIRIIVSDGHKLFFSLVSSGDAKLYGGLDMLADEEEEDNASGNLIEFVPVKKGERKRRSGAFGLPEGSKFGRTEVSLLQICQALKEKLENAETS